MTFEMIDGDLGATEDGSPREIIFQRADGTFVCTREGGGNIAWSADAPDGELMFFELCDMHDRGMIDGKLKFRRLIIRRCQRERRKNGSAPNIRNTRRPTSGLLTE